MVDSLRHIEKEIQRARDNATGMRRLADGERMLASQYDNDEVNAGLDVHSQQAAAYDLRAHQYDDEADGLESTKAQVEAQVEELRARRETIERESSEQIIAIDKELAGLTGSMTI